MHTVEYARQFSSREQMSVWNPNYQLTYWVCISTCLSREVTEDASSPV